MYSEQHMLNLLSARYRSLDRAGLPRWVYAEQVPLVEANRRVDAIALDSRNVPLGERRAWADMAGAPYRDNGQPPLPPTDVHGFEVKVSRADWLTEYRTEGEKSAPWRAYCSHWWLVVPDNTIIKEDELPEGWGLLVGTKRLAVQKPAARTLYEPLPQTLMLTISRYAQKTKGRGNIWPVRDEPT